MNAACSAGDSVSLEGLLSEAARVSAAKAGLGWAFEELVRHNEGRVFRLALHMMQNPEDAEDVMQETFIKAYLHLEQFRGDSRFSTWLLRIAVNEALQNRRRRPTNQVALNDLVDAGDGAELPPQLQEWGDNPEKLCAKSELQRIVLNALDKLAPGYRVVFLLRDMENLTTDETARLLRLSVPTVKSRLLRARLQLREELITFFDARDNRNGNGNGNGHARCD